MTWSNDDEETSIQIIPNNSSAAVADLKGDQLRATICPSCGQTIKLQDQSGGIQDLPGLPAGVKFDPSDQEILQHLEAKVLSDARKLHPLIDEFIISIDGENGICYTHPEKLPGVSKDGQVRHFFHRPSKAYTTGTRKRRKVLTDADGGETRWHKTGKTRPVSTAGGSIKGYKKILVLYTNYGRQRKPEKTNWVMHQYHLGENEEEKDGELVVSKVFYQTQPRQCGMKDQTVVHDHHHVVNMNNNNNNNTNNNNPAGKSRLSGFMEYYNVPVYNVSPYSQQNNVNKNDGPPQQLIQNVIVHGDGSSFIHLPSSASKGK